MFHTARARQAMKTGIQRDRKHQKPIRYSAPVQIRWPEDAVRRGRIGKDGVYFESDEVPRLGQSVVLSLDLTGLGVSLKIAALVVGIVRSEHQVGVNARFNDLSNEAQQLIRRWIDLMRWAKPAEGC